MKRIFDQDIIRRLDNMTQMQKLSPKGRKDIITLLKLLMEEYGVELSADQGEMFISHLTETFHRMEQGEPLELMAASTADQIRNFGGSGIVDQMVQDFCRITDNHFPHSEEEYLKMHLSTLLYSGSSD